MTNNLSLPDISTARAIVIQDTQFKVYRTLIEGATIYIAARSLKVAVQAAKTIHGWKTSHSIVWEKNKRPTHGYVTVELTTEKVEL